MGAGSEEDERREGSMHTEIPPCLLLCTTYVVVNSGKIYFPFGVQNQLLDGLLKPDYYYFFFLYIVGMKIKPPNGEFQNSAPSRSQGSSICRSCVWSEKGAQDQISH